MIDDIFSAASTTKDAFEELTDSEILNVVPFRLNLIRAERTASFSDLLPANLPMNIEPLDVAIINQVELNDTIQRGTVLKIPIQ